jgi:hypothetical protein
MFNLILRMLEHPWLLHLFVCNIVAPTENNSVLLLFLVYVLFPFACFRHFMSYHLIYLLLCILYLIWYIGVYIRYIERSHSHVLLISIFCKSVTEWIELRIS